MRRGPQARSPQEVPGHPHLLRPWEAGSLGSSFLVSGSWPLPGGLGAPRVWGYQVNARGWWPDIWTLPSSLHSGFSAAGGGSPPPGVPVCRSLGLQHGEEWARTFPGWETQQGAGEEGHEPPSREPMASVLWVLGPASRTQPPAGTDHTQGFPASLPHTPPGCGNQCDLRCQWWRGVGGSKGLGCPAP